MKNNIATNIHLSKTTVADLTQLQGNTIRSWSSIALKAMKQQILQQAEKMQ